VIATTPLSPIQRVLGSDFLSRHITTSKAQYCKRDIVSIQEHTVRKRRYDSVALSFCALCVRWNPCSTRIQLFTKFNEKFSIFCYTVVRYLIIIITVYRNKKRRKRISPFSMKKIALPREYHCGKTWRVTLIHFYHSRLPNTFADGYNES